MEAKKQILLIEGDDDNADATATLLRHYGYEVERHPTLEAAAESTIRPDLAIIDIVAHKPEWSLPYPTLYTTAAPSPELGLEALVKPFAPKALQDAIAQRML